MQLNVSKIQLEHIEVFSMKHQTRNRVGLGTDINTIVTQIGHVRAAYSNFISIFLEFFMLLYP